MGNDIKNALRPALSFILLLSLITGLLYPLLIFGLGQALFPHQANGSLIRAGDQVVGSELIGQNFTGPTYFHPRPSAAGEGGYAADASSGTNLGPTSSDLAGTVSEHVAAARVQGATGAIPAHAATASGSGLDPHISPAMAFMQLPRVAAARDIPPALLRRVVDEAIARPTLGMLGEPHINVLLLNRQLDAMRPNSAR